MLRRGPLLMIAATLVLTIMSGAVKVARVEMGTLDLVFWRGLVAIPLAWMVARNGTLRVARRGTFGIRLVLGFGAMLCFFTALKELPLADTTLITKLQPVLIVLGAPLFLGAKERASPRTWILLFVGLVGCLILIAPNVAVGSVWGLWALGASILSAGAHIALRGLKDDRPEAIVLWLQVGVFLLAGLAILVSGGGFHVPPMSVWPAVLAVGGLATVGQLLMTHAYGMEKASRVAAVRFVGPIWGIAGDVLFFGGWPSAHVWIGGLFVVAAGLAVTFESKK